MNGMEICKRRKRTLTGIEKGAKLGRIADKFLPDRHTRHPPPGLGSWFCRHTISTFGSLMHDGLDSFRPRTSEFQGGPNFHQCIATRSAHQTTVKDTLSCPQFPSLSNFALIGRLNCRILLAWVFQTAVHADAVTASQGLFVGNHRSSVPPYSFEIRIRCVKRGLNPKWDQLFHFLRTWWLVKCITSSFVSSATQCIRGLVARSPVR